MSYGRMKTAEPALAAEVKGWLDRADHADAAEDEEHGERRRGDETPDWMACKQRRLAAIRAAKAALEAEAADPPDPDDESGPGASSGMRWQGRALRSEDGGPPDRAQKNFTDPDSRVLPMRDGFIQGYNGQIAVDAAHQVIVAHRLVTTSADYRTLAPLVNDISVHLGRKPREVSGDAGFATEANLAALKAPYQGLSPARMSPSWRGPCRKAPQVDEAAPDERHGRDTQTGGPSQPLPAQKASGRARIRTNQAGQRLPPIPLARPRSSPSRVGDDLHRPQPAQARKRAPGKHQSTKTGDVATPTRSQIPLLGQAPRQCEMRP
jgi:hypothetical protein